MHKSNNSGFSFIEILIVLAIVAGIATLVLQQSDTAVDRSLVQKYYVDLDELRAAAKQYRVQNGSYRGINMSTLFDAGVLPDRFAYREGGSSALQSGNPTISYLTAPDGRSWYLQEHASGQSFVLRVNADLATARQLSRYLGGDAGNCMGISVSQNIVQNCLSIGQPWALREGSNSDLISWAYLAE